MSTAKSPGGNLNLGGLLKDLVADRVMLQTDANGIAANQRSHKEALRHPIQTIAAAQCSHAQTKTTLNVDTLCQWLADRAELDFVALDPLQINVPVVTTAMSFAYAKRYGILCIEVSPDELVVATKEPFATA